MLAALELKRNQLIDKIREHLKQNLDIQQQTNKLYLQSLQYQQEFEIIQNINKFRGQQVSPQQIEELLNQKQVMEANLQQNEKELNEIIIKVDKLKGKTRQLLFLQDKEQHVIEGGRIYISEKAYGFDQILSSNTQFIPHESTRIIIRQLQNDNSLLLLIIQQIFTAFEYQNVVYQLQGVNINSNTDIFDPENTFTSFQKFNNLIKIPIRNMDHMQQIIHQISQGDQSLDGKNLKSPNQINPILLNLSVLLLDKKSTNNQIFESEIIDSNLCDKIDYQLLIIPAQMSQEFIEQKANEILEINSDSYMFTVWNDVNGTNLNVLLNLYQNIAQKSQQRQISITQVYD